MSTLHINVSVAAGQLKDLEDRLAKLGVGPGIQSPLKGLQAQIATDVASIKASLDMLNKHFEDGTIRMSSAGDKRTKKVKDDLTVVSQLTRQSLQGTVAAEQAAGNERLALQSRYDAEAIAAAKAANKAKLEAQNYYLKTQAAALQESQAQADLTAKLRAKSAGAAQAGGVPSSTPSYTLVNGAQLAELRLAASGVKTLGEAHAKASPLVKALAADMNDAHAAARGLAGGFGQVWLTYGSTAPLIAGAALAAGFVGVMKTGLGVQNTFETIRVLSEESAGAVGALTGQMLEMARSGSMGPKEIAEGMKTLSLAGLNALEVSRAIPEVLHLAVAGDTSMKTSAEALSGIATAFNLSASSYGHISDVIAKTAAVSKSSVDSISAAFKAASVINTQYGVTLEDMALGTALLNNLNIQGTAAGTQLRNMYADLAGRTPKVRAALGSLGVDAFEKAAGKARPLLDIIKQLALGMEKFDALTQNRKFQDVFSERGGRPGSSALALDKIIGPETAKKMSEMADGIVKAAADGKIKVASYLEELDAKIRDNIGFTSIAYVRMMQTPLNQLKGIKSAMEATFAETFDSLQPQILQFSADMKKVFGSEEFKEGLKRMALLVGDVILAFVRWGDVLLTIGGAIFALKAAMGINTGLAALGAVATKTSVEMTIAAEATTKLAAAQTLVAKTAVASSATQAAATGGFLANIVSKAGIALRFLSRLVPAITLVWSAYELWTFWTGKASTARENLTIGADNYIAGLKAEYKRLSDINDVKREGLTLDETKGIRQRHSDQQDLVKNLEVAKADQAAVNRSLAAAGNGSRLKEHGVYTLTPQENARKESVDNAVKLAQAKLDGFVTDSKAYELLIKMASKVGQLNAAAEAQRTKIPKVIGTQGVDDTNHTESLANLTKAENKYYTQHKTTLEKAYREDEAAIKGAIADRSLTESEGYFDSLQRTDKYYVDMLKAITEHNDKAKKSLEDAAAPKDPAKAAAFNSSRIEALKMLATSTEEAKNQLDDFYIAQQRVAGSNLRKHTSDEAEAFKKLGTAIRVHNDQLEIRAQAEKEAASLPPAQRVAYTAAASYKAQFADNLEVLRGFYDKAQKEADAYWLRMDQGSDREVSRYEELARAADKAALHVEQRREEIMAGADAEGKRKKVLYQEERAGTKSIELALDTYLDSVSNTASQVGSLVTNAFKGMEDALVSFVTTGKADFASLATSIVRDLIRIQIQQSIMQPLAAASKSGGLLNFLLNLLPGMGGGPPMSPTDFGPVPYANGGAFTNSIITSPTMFKYANGGGFNLGQMGEAGPEAILPLQRNSSGKLGVASSGGGAAPIVNVFVQTPAGQTGKVTQTRNGNNMDIHVMVGAIEDILSDNMSAGQGNLGQAIGARFGLRPAIG
jgi:TP901 family phage tail tape measure protein/lambda family phage tail tape measure protein